MKQYMFIARAKESSESFLDTSDREKFMSVFEEWTGELTKNRRHKDSAQLSKCLKRVGLKSGVTNVKDGPFLEAKEALTGYFLFDAENIEEVTEIAKTCPVLRFDDLEIYEII